MSRNTIKGSFEEVRDKVQEAARDHFKPKDKRDDGPEIGCWAYVEATFPTHAIVTVEMDGGKCKQYRIPYTFDDAGDVQLGEPEKVELTVVVYDGDDETEPGEDDEAIATRILPALDRIKVATRLVQSSPEVKAESLVDLEAGVLELLDAMAGKGADVRSALGLGGEDVDPLAAGEVGYDEEDPAADDVEGKGGFSHVPMEPDSPDDEDREYEVKDDGRVSLDPAAVQAQLAALQA